MKRKMFSPELRASFLTRGLGAACLAAAVLGAAMMLAPRVSSAAEAKPAEITSIKGTCTFGGQKSTWSAKLTFKGDNTYDAVYVSSWGGRTLNFTGAVRTDLKTEISGRGSGKDGTFEFAGKYGDQGVAYCQYKETGGRNRNGSLTAETPR